MVVPTQLFVAEQRLTHVRDHPVEQEHVNVYSA
jgi:hypothetical protein